MLQFIFIFIYKNKSIAKEIYAEDFKTIYATKKEVINDKEMLHINNSSSKRDKGVK